MPLRWRSTHNAPSSSPPAYLPAGVPGRPPDAVAFANGRCWGRLLAAAVFIHPSTERWAAGPPVEDLQVCLSSAARSRAIAASLLLPEPCLPWHLPASATRLPLRPPWRRCAMAASSSTAPPLPASESARCLGALMAAAAALQGAPAMYVRCTLRRHNYCCCRGLQAAGSHAAMQAAGSAAMLPAADMQACVGVELPPGAHC